MEGENFTAIFITVIEEIYKYAEHRRQTKTF